jgi:hypothetical protein
MAIGVFSWDEIMPPAESGVNQQGKASNGCEQDESAVSGTIHAAVALTTRKKRESVSGKRNRSEAM